jgi:3-oxoacyl-[acyl-carrier-protein] synthase III
LYLWAIRDKLLDLSNHMATFKFNTVHIESFGINNPPHEVTSAELEDKLAPLYASMGVPIGTLERLSGIHARRFFDRTVSPSQAAIPAALSALDQVGFDKQKIDAVFNCSVSRDHFEPATAAKIHKNLGLKSSGMVMDITNACLGFSNGLIALASLIESGAIKAGMLVAAETMSGIVERSIEKLGDPKNWPSREQLLRMLPSLTLGSGAVSMVLAHESVATKPHKVLSATSHSASEFAELCVGNADFCFYMDDEDFNPLMETDSPNLIANGALLGREVWKEMQETTGWSNSSFQTHVSHQVGKQLGDKFFNTVGVDNTKEFSIYKDLGNQVSCALPTAFAMAVDAGLIVPGSKALLTGFGGGLNSIFTAVAW